MSFRRGRSAQSESQQLNTLFVGRRKWPDFCRYCSLSLRTCVPFARSTAPPGSPCAPPRPSDGAATACWQAPGTWWAWVIDRNSRLREQHCPQVASFSALCRELTGTSFEGAVATLRRGGPEELLHRILRGGQAKE